MRPRLANIGDFRKFHPCKHTHTHTHTSDLMNTHMCIRFSMYPILLQFSSICIQIMANIWRPKFESISFFLSSFFLSSFFLFFLSFFFSLALQGLGKKEREEKKRVLAPHDSTFWSVFIGPSSGVLRVQALPRFYLFCRPRCVKCTEAFVRRAKTTHRILSSVSNGWEGGRLKGGYKETKSHLQRARALQSMSHKGLWSVTSCRVVPDVIAGFPKIENHTQRRAPPHNILKEAAAKRRRFQREWSLLHFD